ncbi:hypothetical protein G6553_07410 [Nocardioides sp. IC4_145]|uniref:hypothetical protein n=1 Tax=Nocardioides sp. IC4_145 TaxID=2714037 RepID=UPI00140748E6|nr:hypothetical protein [Nocardioides sp. IC4_145]NHC22996.1 hypothetical protein [Nocardioides sp. IC4_145]
MTTDIALQAADAVFMAEQTVGRARRVVDELHTTINSALLVLDDAELDSARARFSDRGDYYLEAAGEHLDRLQTRCEDAKHLIHGVYGHLDLAVQALAALGDLLSAADGLDFAVVADLADLRPRIAVVSEMVILGKPVARAAVRHVESARAAARQATPASLLEPVTLERSIATAGKELGRADEDVRLLENVVDHAAANARQSAGIASDITDNARRRMAEQGRAQVPRQASPAVGSPAR